MRILYINELLPGPTTASAAILQRHMDWPNAHWTLIGEEDIHVPEMMQRFRNRILSPLSKQLSFRFEQDVETRWAVTDLSKKFDRKQFDLVLTLAHGRLGLHAWRLARELDLPMATIFHDWWPELMASPKTPQTQIRQAEMAFEKLQAHSDIAFAVCPGMAEHLVHARQTELLLPMPDPQIVAAPSEKKPSQPLRVTYAGSLWHPYGKMIVDLADQLASQSNVQLRVHGDRKYLDPVDADRLEKRGQFFSLVPIDEFCKIVTRGSDVLLAVMGDGEAGKCRMQTSFPSKVTNYFRTGNAVFIWAPESSSLGRFASGCNLQLAQSKLDSALVAQQISVLADDESAFAAARQEAAAIGKDHFDPQQLNAQFYEQLRQLSERSGSVAANTNQS